MPYMTKQLSKEIITRPILRNNFWEMGRNIIKFWKIYERYKKLLNVKEITNKKMFWKTIKPFLSGNSCIRTLEST